MRHHHLGTLDGSVLVFGGPYSNAHATLALFEEAAKRKIKPSHLMCTGDTVAYCGDPALTVDMVRQAGCSVVAGNCEIQLAKGEAECGCGFEQGTACDIASLLWFAFAKEQLSQKDIDWMADLPDVITFDHQGERYAVLHGGATDVARFIWRVSPMEEFEREWAALTAEIGRVNHVIAGHSGLPFIKETPFGRWINAGAIGMPAHDGRSYTHFMVLEDGAVQMSRLPYDVKGAQGVMENAGLMQGYDIALETGYWPSEDILPPALRRR